MIHRQPNIDRLLLVRQVQEILNISRSRAYGLIADGHFVALKVGGSLRVTEKSVEDYMERQKALFKLMNEDFVQDVP